MVQEWVTSKELLISNDDCQVDANLSSIELRPYEARVYRLGQTPSLT